MSIENQQDSREQKESALYLLSENVRPVRRLNGYVPYGDDMVPQWGDRVGLWYSPTGDLAYIGKTAWYVIDELSRGASYNELAEIFNDRHLADVLYPLTRAGMVVSRGEKTISISDKPPRAEVYVQLTQQCNFKCTGCCAGSDMVVNGSSLDGALLRRYIDAAARSAHEMNIDELTLKFAGGEPTLSRPYALIQDVQAYIQEMSDRHSLRISQTILSNGVPLTREKIEWLKNHEIHLVISIWGIGDTNNILRGTTPNNGKSWQRIRQAINYCASEAVPFNVLTVVTPDHPEQLKNIIGALWDPDNPEYLLRGVRNVDPIKLAVNFWRPQTTEQSQMYNDSVKRLRRGIRTGLAEIIRIVSNGNRVSLPDMWDYLNLLHTTTRTCGSGYYYALVGPNGIGSCHEEATTMHTDRNERVFQGDNLFSVASEDYKQFGQKFMDRKNSFRADHIQFTQGIQDLQYHGGGGCPRMRIQEKNPGEPPTMVREIYQPLAEEFLSLYLQTRQERKGASRVSYEFGFQPCAGCPTDDRCELRPLADAMKLHHREITSMDSLESLGKYIQTLCCRESPWNGNHHIVDDQFEEGRVQQVYVDCPNKTYRSSPSDGSEERGYTSYTIREYNPNNPIIYFV